MPARGRRTEWPIVDRVALVENLAPRFDRIPAHGVFIVGQAGVGKTVLARQLADAAAAPETVTVIGLSALSGVSLAAWAPTLATRGLPADPHRAVAALVAELGAHPEQQILLVDDAPRLDSISAAVVYQLVRGFGVPAILTARLGEPLPDGIRRLLDEGLVERVDVPGLSWDEAVELLERRFDGQVRHGDLDRLLSRTEGNPLYIRALVEAAVRDGAVRLSDGVVVIEDGRTPPELLDAVTQRLEVLDAAVHRALQLVALVQPIRREALLSGAMATLTPDVLDHLELSGLVVHTSDGDLRIAHPLIAEALERDDTAEDVFADSVALLRSLEGDAARLAACRIEWRRGELDSTEAAWAAEYAFATGDLVHAAEYAHTAVGDPSAPIRFRGHLVLADAASLTGDRSQADDSFVSAEECARRPEEWARLAAHRGEHLAFRCFEVSAAIEQAERIRRSLPGESVSGTDADLRLWRAVRGEDYRAPLPEGSSSLGPPDVRIREAMAAIMHESMAGRTELGDEAEQILRRLGDQLGRLDASAAMMLGFAEYIGMLSRGEGEKAAEFATARRIDAGEGVGLWTCTLAEHRSYNGRLREAGRLAALAVDQLRWRDGMGVLPLAVALQADAAAKGGDPGRARRLLDALSPDQRNEPKALMVIAEVEAWLLADDGDAEEAATVVERAARQAIDVGFRLVAAISLGLCLRLGVVDRAAAMLEEICRDVPPDFGLYTSLRDLAVALRERRPAAVVEPAARLASAGMPPTALDAISLARTMRPSNETRYRLDRLFGAWASEVDAPLRRRRESPVLSRRELDVAARAADRQRTREIAQALGISPSTVNNQLNSVFRKLGVSSRDELRDVLVELGRPTAGGQT